MLHNLKSWRWVYNDVVATQKKTFEIRKNDRNFSVGDAIIFWEVNDEGAETGIKSKPFIITYLLTHEQFPQGIQEGYCAFGIEAHGWFALDHNDNASPLDS
jgi:hypothetical protein